MSKMKFYKSPKGKLFYNKYVKEFNPYNPSPKLLELLENNTVSKSSYITGSLRGKKYSDITLENASYIGYEAKMGSDDNRLLAKIKYFIELTKDDDVSEEELQELLFDEEVGIKVKEKQNDDGCKMKKPNLF